MCGWFPMSWKNVSHVTCIFKGSRSLEPWILDIKVAFFQNVMKHSMMQCHIPQYHNPAKSLCITYTCMYYCEWVVVPLVAVQIGLCAGYELQLTAQRLFVPGVSKPGVTTQSCDVITFMYWLCHEIQNRKMDMESFKLVGILLHTQHLIIYKHKNFCF